MVFCIQQWKRLHFTLHAGQCPLFSNGNLQSNSISQAPYSASCSLGSVGNVEHEESRENEVLKGQLASNSPIWYLPSDWERLSLLANHFSNKTLSLCPHLLNPVKDKRSKKRASMLMASRRTWLKQEEKAAAAAISCSPCIPVPSYPYLGALSPLAEALRILCDIPGDSSLPSLLPPALVSQFWLQLQLITVISCLA